MSAFGGHRAQLRWLAAGLAAALLAALSYVYLDRPSAYWARDLAPALVAFCRGLTALGNSAWYLVPLGLALLLLYFAGLRGADQQGAARMERWFWTVLFLFAAIAVSGLTTDLLKVLFGRARPLLLLREGDFGWHPLAFKASRQGFPSGHANTVTTVALALAMLAPRWRAALAVAAIPVILTRIAVSEHYPSDLIAGAAVAFATTFPLRAAFARHGRVFRRTAHGRFVPCDTPLDDDAKGRS